MYAYSKRDKTHASRNFSDDVPKEVKQRRLQEVIDTFRSVVQEKNEKEVVGGYELLLVEGAARKSSTSNSSLTGRTDGNKRCVFTVNSTTTDGATIHRDSPQFGDYVVVKITEARGHTLRGVFVGKSTLSDWSLSKK